MGLYLAQKKNKNNFKEYCNTANELKKVPKLIKKILELDNNIFQISKQYIESSNFLYLGRGYQFPVALEGALKLKEISYIHAEGYPAAEM